MYTGLFLIMLASYITCYVIENREDDREREIGKTERQQREKLQTRCTRRFSPGVCMDEVRPVWTYNFHLQNCTERLGCKQTSVSNRFLSYEWCMFSCQSLIHIYNYILSQQTDYNDTQWAQKKEMMRRSGQELLTDLDLSEEGRVPQFDPYDPLVENLRAAREDPEQLALAEALPSDLDYRSPDFVHFDPIHRPLQY